MKNFAKMTAEQQALVSDFDSEMETEIAICIAKLRTFDGVGYKGEVKLPALAADGVTSVIVGSNNDVSRARAYWVSRLRCACDGYGAYRSRDLVPAEYHRDAAI